MNKIILILLLGISLYAKTIEPYRYVEASHPVSDFVKVEDTLIIATEEGVIDIYDLKKDKLVDQIVLPKYKNILEEYMRSLILSVDYLGGDIVFIGRVLDGYRELYIYKNKKIITLIDATQRKTIQKVRFIDKNNLIIQDMGNELSLYNIKEKKAIYKKQLNYASFSDFVLSEDKKHIYTADETPVTYKIDVKNGNIITKYNKANKRDIFSVDFKNNTLLTGGKDKRVILYEDENNFKMTKGQFFIYSVALNPKATLGAFVKNEQNEISVVNTRNMKEVHLLKGHKQTILKIEFLSKDELISADESKQILFWKLK